MVWNKWNCLYNWMSSDFLKEEKIVNSALENKSICDGNIGTCFSWGWSSDWWPMSLQWHKELQLCVSAAETPLSPSCLCLSMFFPFLRWKDERQRHYSRRVVMRGDKDVQGSGVCRALRKTLNTIISLSFSHFKAKLNQIPSHKQSSSI